MLTPEEFNALLYVLQRCPLGAMEAVGLNMILAKIAPPTPPPPGGNKAETQPSELHH